MSNINPSVVPEYCLKTLVQEWLECYKEGDFLNVLKRHWRTFVLISVQQDDAAKVERLIQKFLLHPMEVFLCNGEDPEDVLKKLKERDKPSQLCGHVFKNGEPNYSCRDCATDATCVLCMECFETSVHKLEKHRYRINTSSGGGYCDCGDPEAWKTEAFCQKHKPSSDQEVERNPIEELPDDLIDRASALFLSTLKYTVELLTWTQSDSLPTGLQPEGELDDEYFCMLFNDEVHTYEQVISALQRSVLCDHQQAVEFAMTVDREGRSPVLNGKFEACEQARNKIERHTSRHGKALKVQVMHNSVVAHQQFALRMISWLQNIINMSDGLKRLFCLLSMQAQENEKSVMEVLLLADTQLWKAARLQSHQLMMTGVLMDPECKRKFSVFFTKHYGKLMKDFSQDDHDHDVSVASLSVQIFTVVSLHYSPIMRSFILDDHYRTASVTKISAQIFTVPSLARYLVSEHNLLSVILQTFLQACDEKKNKEGILNFERTGTATFKRACYSLHDLKYALICKPGPGEWTDNLRRGFLEGFSYFLQVLKLVEGMDAVTRQTGQHLEFEPEWEGAFHLQLKLEDNIALLLEWCGSDRQVLMEAYNKALEVFDSCKHVNPKTNAPLTVAGHTSQCIVYDVATQPVSIHLPVTRMIAGLHTYLGAQGLKFESPDCCLVRPNPMLLIELPLRVKVLVAQFRANMWRRNGYALINQIIFYHNVKCRSEMHDRDVIMLQAGASLCNRKESNSFIIQLLYKFGLKSWIREEYDVPTGEEDSLRQTIALAEEFLELLIVLISERFVPGIGQITKEDIVKREVIHHLSIAPMAHSELVKALHEDYNHETGLEKTVKDVAQFKMQGGKGKYELNTECYSEYNPFFYHYSKSEKSKSEEAQLKRRKEINESLALPPPVPPKFTPEFQPIANLLQCDVMIYIMELVLTRTMASRSRSWSEMQLERVLHLIGIALHEQKQAMVSGNQEFDFLSRASQPIIDSLKGKKESKSIQVLLEGIVNAQNITHDSTRDLVAWTHKLMTEVRQLKSSSSAITETVEHVSTPKDEKAEAMRKKKAAAAEKRRQKIMAQMSSMQKDFIKQNSELFENTSTELMPRSGSDMDLSETASCSTNTFPVAVGPKRTPCGQGSPILGNCILCQEEQEVTLTGRTYVLTGFVQKSTVLAMSHGDALVKGVSHDPLLMRSDLNTGTHTSSCGHMMHAECWQGFFDNILIRDRRRPVRFRQNHSYDVEKMEFLCPLCRCISNTVIPVIPASPISSSPLSRDVPLSFVSWLDGMHKTVLNSVQEPDEMDTSEDTVSYLPCPISTVTSTMEEGAARNFQSLWSHDQWSGGFSEESFSLEMKEMIRKYTRDTFSVGLSLDPDDDNARVPLMAWNTSAFTIQSLEQVLRDEGKSVFGHLSSRHNDCLRAVVKTAALNSSINNPDVSKEHCIHLLSFLFPDVLKTKNPDKMCILDVDMFHFLTSLVMALPSLHLDTAKPSSTFVLPNGGVNDQHALHLVLAVHLVQILLLFDEDNCGMDVDGEYEGEALLILYDKLHSLANIRRQNQPLPWQLTVHVRRAMLPFLRCTALLFHYLTGVTAPNGLTGIITKKDDFDDTCKTLGDEFETLCKYLGITSHMSRLLENQGALMDTLISRWCKNPALKEKLSASSVPPVQYPLPINHLVPLPLDFSELINTVSTFTCPKSDGDDSRAPTMCLVCGKMLCSQSYCCQTQFNGVSVGAATEHTYKCGAGVGVFLRVRECQILLLAGRRKGCFVPPPYIDDYGETDQGLRRGNALHLCEESYEQLQKIWMSHSIPETIAHNLETTSSLLSIDWQHL